MNNKAIARFLKNPWVMLWKIVLLSAASGVIFLVWVLAIRLVEQSDVLALPHEQLTTILFGAASLALFVLSIGIGVLAIFGWKSLQDTIRGQVDKEVVRLGNELRGRTLSAVGYLAGEMSLKLSDEGLEIIDKDRLSECIELCRYGYENLSLFNGPGKYMALNNLLYYSIIDGGGKQDSQLLQGAFELLKVSQERNQINLALTACGAILKFSGDEKQRRTAVELLESYKKNSKLTSKQRNELARYLAFSGENGEKGSVGS